MNEQFTVKTYTSQGWAIDEGVVANTLGVLSPLNLDAAYVTPANPVKSMNTEYTFIF